jgi:predicted phage terminase large subunit-like protein
MLLPWLWTRMPSFRFLGGSYSADLSLEFGNKARRLIKSSLYQETFPEITILDDQDTKGYFANSLKGERYSTSTGASIIGRHFHLHSIDDPINPRGARSELELRTTNLWLTESVAQRCVNLQITPLILTMQRLALEDPSGIRLARTGGTPVRHICLPAELSDDVKPVRLRSKYKKGLLDPIRLNPDILETRRCELGQYGYAGQFEQRPSPITGGMFDVTALVGPKAPPDPKEFSHVIRWWDKASSSGYGDYTAGVLMGIKANPKAVPRFWILDVFRKQLGSVEREEVIKKTAKVDQERWPGNYRVGVEQEPGSGGKDSAMATVWNLAGFKVEMEKPTGSKLDRADPFATQVNAGNVAFLPGQWNNTYMEELQYFGELAKFDDQVDASAAAFNFLSRKKYKAGALF